ncbi:hypothetical protein LG943_13025 [Streptomonospora sp. S1-112]|uniref:Uncharacterized protein n=1 Tax=Streptomonospora mangrovi TaxID=2883123 RepID=A0A9X3NKM5_9ACTN|nr:hypothetical protein [Streptomonospora mangrovi]MDA0565232.1 hypothetical protein [Streptomonospora mangrovi]
MTEEINDVPTCGRPTRSGKPCRIRISRFDVACGTHATEHDRALADAYRRGYNEGWKAGSATGEQGAQARIRFLEARLRELQERDDAAKRIFEVGGEQVVEVDGYAYRWRGHPPLVVGERVLLPENWLSSLKRGSGPFIGVVTKLGTTYKGHLAQVINRAPVEKP